mmetsp:Transcript_17429/g.41023  ORF Transcript_17429/g.41023 Transcript_17429/m.41023 type:complete len:202 (-) Transcript_17429:1999-2604(-)
MRARALCGRGLAPGVGPLPRAAAPEDAPVYGTRSDSSAMSKSVPLSDPTPDASERLEEWYCGRGGGGVLCRTGARRRAARSSALLMRPCRLAASVQCSCAFLVTSSSALVRPSTSLLSWWICACDAAFSSLSCSTIPPVPDSRYCRSSLRIRARLDSSSARAAMSRCACAWMSSLARRSTCRECSNSLTFLCSWLTSSRAL